MIRRISALVEEEHTLEGSDDTGRLRELEVALDQCWDLLRQRRARRNTGDDPDAAAVRPPRWSSATSSSRPQSAAVNTATS